MYSYITSTFQYTSRQISVPTEAGMSGCSHTLPLLLFLPPYFRLSDSEIASIGRCKFSDIDHPSVSIWGGNLSLSVSRYRICWASSSDSLIDNHGRPTVLSPIPLRFLLYTKRTEGNPPPKRYTPSEETVIGLPAAGPAKPIMRASVAVSIFALLAPPFAAASSDLAYCATSNTGSSYSAGE